MNDYFDYFDAYIKNTSMDQSKYMRSFDIGRNGTL